MSNELDNTLTRLDSIHPEWVAYIRDVEERYPYDRMVGLVVHDNGEAYDVCFGWEAAESYALDQGMRVLALQGDGRFSRVDLQRMLDLTRREYQDCFGE